MCSILAVLEVPTGTESGGIAAVRARAIELSRRMRHRGPDWSGVFHDERNVLVHERLAIVGIESGAQPLRSKDGRHLLAVNGEIYNHRDLEKGFPEYEL
ncbi:MAG: asparagine synthase (glutamine-hydrolyzing), partial [Planctomycetota bacterium]